MIERTDPHSSALRTSVWEWAQVALLIVNLTWTTLCLGGFRAETMILTSALNGALLTVHLISRIVERARDDSEVPPAGWLGFHPAGWLLLPFTVYAAVNTRWISPVPWLGWLDWLGWAQMIAVFWVVLNGVRTTAARTILVWAMMALGVVGVLLACYQKFVAPDWLMLGRTQAPHFVGRCSGPFGIPNSLAALLLLLLPPAAALALRRGANAVARVWWGYLVLVFALGLVLTVSRGAWLSLAIVAAGWPVVGLRGSLMRRLLVSGGMLAAAVGVVTVLFFTVPLARERLVTMKEQLGEHSRPIMWRGAWEIFCEHPAVGSGAGSYNVVFERHRPETFQDEPVWAHNDYLNTLSDYGAVGFALFFGACAVIAGCCVGGEREAPAGRRFGGWAMDDRLVVQGIAAGVVAFALQLFVDFHFKIPALALALAVFSALVVQRTWPERRWSWAWSAKWETDACVVAATFVVAATLWFVTPLYRGEALRRAGRQAIEELGRESFHASHWADVTSDARAALEQAVAIAPRNAGAWADLSYALSVRAHVESARTPELGREALRAADEALALSQDVPEFWVRRAVALDMQDRHLEAGAAMIRALQLAPANARIWYYHAFHLSLGKNETARALAAVAFCLRLDAGIAPAQALRQRLADRSRVP